jgi:adenylate cyclase
MVDSDIMGTEGNIERERRFFVDGRDEKPWRNDDPKHIVQHYLNRELLSLNGNVLEYDGIVLFGLKDDDLARYKESKGWGARLRRENDEFIFTLKTKGDLEDDASNYELEGKISERVYVKILDGRMTPYIQKTRYVWKDIQGLEWETDEFEGKLAGLVLVEVELDAEQEIHEFPPWAGHEITGLDSWSNRALAETLASTR